RLGDFARMPREKPSSPPNRGQVASINLLVEIELAGQRPARTTFCQKRFHSGADRVTRCQRTLPDYAAFAGAASKLDTVAHRVIAGFYRGACRVQWPFLF